MSSVEMVETWINDRWSLLLPKHRHDRPEWPWWEAGRLAAMYHYLVHANRYDVTPIGVMGKQYVPGAGQVVYDIGAEEGDFPALYSLWGCDVVLFEPNERVWPNIKAIWDANDLRDPLATFIGFAASEETDPPCDLNRQGLHWIWPAAAHGEVIGDHGFKNLSERTEDVAITTIDAMAREIAPPTAITIDVEGAEYEVLLGAREVLSGKKKPKVWVSVHRSDAKERYGHDDVLLKIRDLMGDCGYPDDGLGTFIASDHEEHWMWIP